MGNTFGSLNGLNHVWHSAILLVVSYVVMTQALKQSPNVAFDRSVILASLALIYMVMFGHQFPPGKLNPNLNF